MRNFQPYIGHHAERVEYVPDGLIVPMSGLPIGTRAIRLGSRGEDGLPVGQAVPGGWLRHLCRYHGAPCPVTTTFPAPNMADLGRTASVRTPSPVVERREIRPGLPKLYCCALSVNM